MTAMNDDGARVEDDRGACSRLRRSTSGKDGSRIPVLIGAATFEEGGNQGVAFVLDLTERKCAEQAAEHLASIVESPTTPSSARISTE